MKRILILLTLVMMVVWSFAAITQTGYVKTRGRLGNNGQVIPGKRLGGATVVLQNGSSAASNESGNFSLALPSNSFFLKNVKKVGYIVSDPDALSKQYTYSTNPLILTLDKLENQQNDELATEKRLRQKTERELAKRKKEIDQLKKENKITQAQYDEALQKISADRESAEKLVMDMAERYSKIDFDQLDDYQRQMATFIQNGELAKADSLLRTKGSMDDREDEIRRIRETNAKGRQKIEELVEAQTQNETTETTLVEDFIADCYLNFEICKLKFDNDSAAYWLERRALVDTLNFNYVWECGNFLLHERKYDKAQYYLELLTRNETLEKVDLGMAYNDLSLCYCYKGLFDKGLEAIYKSLQLREELAKFEPEKYTVSLALVYSNYAAQNAICGNLDRAKTYFLRGLELYKKLENCIPFFAVNIANVKENYSDLLIKNSKIDEAQQLLIEAYATRNDYATQYPTFYNTIRNIPLRDIDEIIGDVSCDSIILTRECKMIIRSAAELNKEQMVSSSARLALIYYQNNDLERFRYYLKENMALTKELFDLNSSKYLPDRTNSLLDAAQFYYYQLHDTILAHDIVNSLIEIVESCDSYINNFSKDLAMCDAWTLKGKILGQSNFEDGLKYLTQASKILDNIVSLSGELMSNSGILYRKDDIYNAIAMLNFENQRLNNGLEFYKKRTKIYTEDILLNLSDEDKKNFLRKKSAADFDLINALIQLNQDNEVCEKICTLVQTMSKNKDLFSNMDFFRMYLLYGISLSNIGKKDEALIILKKADNILVNMEENQHIESMRTMLDNLFIEIKNY